MTCIRSQKCKLCGKLYFRHEFVNDPVRFLLNPTRLRDDCSDEQCPECFAETGGKTPSIFKRFMKWLKRNNDDIR